MQRLVRGLLAIGSWLCCFHWLSSALADNSNPCSIQRNQTGQLFPNNSLATRLASEGAESFFEVKCSGKSAGMLRLSIDRSRTEAHSGYVQIRLLSANGIFNSASSGFTSDVLNVPYGIADGGGVGKVIYQVQISAQDRQLLRAARDYSVTVNAELLP